MLCYVWYLNQNSRSKYINEQT